MTSFCPGSIPFLLLIVCAVSTIQGAQAKQPATARPGKALQAQSQSSINYSTAADGSQTVEILNVTYEFTGAGIPGRPSNERLLLRKTIHSKGAIDDIGVEATVTLEAWPLGVDLKQKPLYKLTETGTAGQTVYPDLFVVDRQLEEVEWWSVHKLGNGQHLFDTYVPLVTFSILREVVTTRYAGLEVPPDDVKDVRLREPHVVAVLTYASGELVIREALLTCDDPQQATLLRSYADSTRTLMEIEGAPGTGRGKASEPRRSLKLSISQNYPSPPVTIDVLVPIAGDDLDLAHAQLPPRMHLAAWKR
jgi:hypothetical protein